PNHDDRYQSAGAVNIEIMSPRPERLRLTGAPATTLLSTRRVCGHALWVVRLTPEMRSTDWSSANPLTDAPVCTTTCGRLPAATLPMSHTVPDPTETITLACRHPSTASATV